MQKLLTQMVHEDDGVLSFEWTMLLTLLVIGIVSGLAGARDAIIDELGDLAQAAQSIDQSFSLAGITIVGVFETPDSEFQEIDGVDNAYTDCARTTAPTGQGPEADTDS